MICKIETKQLFELLKFEFQKATLFMYGDPVFYNWMTFTEALGLDKSFECITAPLHGVIIENSF